MSVETIIMVEIEKQSIHDVAYTKGTNELRPPRRVLEWRGTTGKNKERET